MIMIILNPDYGIRLKKKVEQKSRSLANWSVIFSSQWTEGMIPEKGFGTTPYTYLLEGAKLQNWKQIAHWHQVWMRKKATTLIWTSSCYQVWWWIRTGLTSICFAVHLQKMMPPMLFWSIQTLCEQQNCRTFPPVLWLDSTFLYVWHIFIMFCSSAVHHQRCILHSGMPYLWICVLLTLNSSQIFLGGVTSSWSAL